MLRIFIGYDPAEPVAYHVLGHSILRRASIPVAITPLARHTFGRLHTRPRGPLDSTDFSLTRFLVPALCNFEGMALYMDCDMLVRCDIAQLLQWVEQDKSRDVWVAQHDYTPKHQTKFLGQIQSRYPRKNWSSLMLFNCHSCDSLQSAYVNEAPGLDLHRFAWTVDERIGSVGLGFNWLVGEYDYNPDASIVHFTQGGPWFDAYRDCDYADEWFAERRLAGLAKQ